MIGEVKCCNERCGKIFLGTARAKYCSKRCQSAYLRSKKKSEIEHASEDKQSGVGAPN